MNYEEIKQAVHEGKQVHWCNDGYIIVEKDGTFYIKCLINNHMLPLIYDGEMQEDEKDFFISEVK